MAEVFSHIPEHHVVDLAREADFTIAAMAVRPTACEVEIAGVVHKLEPRAMQVLVALVQAKGAVVSRDALIQSCWAGVIVGDDAINRTVFRVRQISQVGPSPSFKLETIPKIGYRLIPSAAKAAEPAVNETSQGFRLNRTQWRFVAGGAAAALIAIAAFVFFGPERTLTVRAVPFVAVLPFDNLSAEADTRYFSDGLSEDILNALMRSGDIRVAARNSSFQFRGDKKAQAAAALGATHILEGSVRRESGRVRVTASLSDAREHETLWSKSYDRELKETLALQEEVARDVAQSLGVKLIGPAGAMAPPTDPVAYELNLRARDHFREVSQPGRDRAVIEYKECIARAPNYSRCWSGLAWTLYASSAHFSASVAAGMRDEAVKAAERAVALDKSNAEPYMTLAVLAPGGEFEQVLEKGLAIEPHNAQLLRLRGNAKLFWGYVADAVADTERARDLDPLEPQIVAQLTFALRAAGRKAEAWKLVEEGLKRFPVYKTLMQSRSLMLYYDGDFDGALEMLAPDAPRPVALTERFVVEKRMELRALKSRLPGDVEAVFQTWREHAKSDPQFAARWYPTNVIFMLVQLGRKDDAYRQLERNRRLTRFGDTPASPPLVYTHDHHFWDAAFADFRRDPRFLLIFEPAGALDRWRDTDRWPDFCSEPSLPYDCKAEVAKLVATRAVQPPS